VHADGTVAGCTEYDERIGCRGRDEQPEIGPERCVEWFPDGGVHLDG